MKEQRTCPCGNEFIAVRKDQFTCCKRCRNLFYMRKWHEEHPHYSSESGKKWRMEHPEKAKLLNRMKYHKEQINRHLSNLMENINDVVFTKVQENPLFIKKMIYRTKNASNPMVKVVPKKPEPIMITPDNKPIEENTKIVATYAFKHIHVYLFQRSNGTYFWKAYINNRRSIESVNDFADSKKALSDIRTCFV